MRHHGTPERLLQRLTESGQRIHRDVLATVLFGKAFGVEDTLIPHPGVILHPQTDDVDRQLVCFGMKLLGQIARRAAASLLAVGKNDDETWLAGRAVASGVFSSHLAREGAQPLAIIWVGELHPEL